MLELKKEQRARLADTAADAGNIVFGALVVGQALGDRPPSALAMAAGFIIWLAFVVFSTIIAKEPPQ